VQSHSSFRHGAAIDMTKEAYGQAYQRGYNLTVRFLISRGVPCDTARDVAQAAWVKGWERIIQLRNHSMVTTWVNAIALNVHRSVLRSERTFQAMPEYSTGSGVNLAAIDLHRILSFCAPRDRALLELQMQGDTAEEIARKQGVTETAIRIRLLRARRTARSKAERKPVRGVNPPRAMRREASEAALAKENMV
jgi:DNA-directed RNA polymerase specialized sigma24 family protein